MAESWQDRHPAPSQSPLASVVVCTRNRARLLDRCVRSLAGQTVAPSRYEIVVVDDGSTDDTPATCRRLGRRIPNLQLISIEQSVGGAEARNMGISSCDGDPVLCVDDDCVAAPNWLGHMLGALEREPVVAGAVAAPRDSYFQLCHNLAEFHRFLPCRRAGAVSWIANANAGYRRAVIAEVGPFRSVRGMADDMEFAVRARALGYQPYFEPRAVVAHHSPRGAPTEVFSYAARHATAAIRIRLRDPALTGTPRLFRHPIMLLLASPLIALRVTAEVYLAGSPMWALLHTAPVVYALKVAWCVGAARSLLAESVDEQ